MSNDGIVYGSVRKSMDRLRQLTWDNLTASDEEVTKVRLWISSLDSPSSRWAELIQQIALDWLIERPDEEERRLPDGMFLEILDDRRR